MIGRRLADNAAVFAPGDYAKWIDQDGKVTWMCQVPDGQMGNLGNHAVTEHEDGTITVSPSILITGRRSDSKTVWHGFLERGIWRQS